MAFNEVAKNKSEYMRSFYLKAKRSIAKATAEGPAAYVFPASDPRPGQQARLLLLMQRQGVEIQRLTADASVAGRSFPSGSYVIRMDQPFSRLADMFLDRQYYSTQDPPPYDDTGWTLGPLFNVATERIEDPSILKAAMAPVMDTVRAPGGLAASASGATAFLVNYNADNNLTAFRYKYRNLKIDAAEASFSSNGHDFGAGSFIIRTQGNPSGLANTLDAAGKDYGFTAYPASSVPTVSTHAVTAPRIAVLHSWQSTQTEGWLRIGLDEYKIPYDYVGPQDIRDTPRLLDKWDVILVGAGNSVAALVTGVTGDKPIPWKASSLTPNLGQPASSEDIRGGLEFKGVTALMNFVNDGGTLVTMASSSALPIQFGLSNGVTIQQRDNLWAPGSVFRADVEDAASPIVYGYGSELGVFFDTSPIFSDPNGGGGRGFGRGGRGGAETDPALAHVGGTTERHSSRGGINDEDIVQGRPRIMGQMMAQGGAAGSGRGGRGGRGGRSGGGGGRGGAGQAGGAMGADTPQVAGGRGGFGGGGFGGGGRGGRGGGGAGFGENRVVVRYTPDARNLLISGGLDYAPEMTNTPALIQSSVGKGNVVMFSFNPFWRGETLGSYALVFNTLLHHASLGAGEKSAAER